jgi:alginate O-acetyltransferase complex protein AlgI
LPPPPSGTILRFAREPGVGLIGQNDYVALERPELFADHDHLDAAGSARFSSLLGRDVARTLAMGSTGVTGVTRATAAAAAPGQSAGEESAGGSWAAVGNALGIGEPIDLQSLDYAIFFGLVALLFYLLPKPLKMAALLLASYYFYARWNAWYLLLLVIITLCDFAIALAIPRFVRKRRLLLLGTGIALNLAFLGTFKYLNFLTASVARVLGVHGNPWLLSVLVPVGISFHTFQSISYLVDVSRRKMKPITNLRDYALYISFFPQLLAGPIVRAERFFGELAAWRVPSVDRIERGLREIVLGLFKKLVIADQFAPAANAYFADVGSHAGVLSAWSGVFAFTIQIYFDFSGYSDLAIGSARLLGFDFPENFRRPYLATSITDFWRRWHITLSTWLRDYLYIPLGGSRGSRSATVRNLMITMLLGGLWHGANWTFVAWGAYHGALLSVERVTGFGRTDPHGSFARVVRTIATFVLVMFGWILFRAQSFHEARAVFFAMLNPWAGMGHVLIGPWQTGLLCVCLAVGIAQERGARWLPFAMPIALQAVAGAVVLLLVETCSWPGAPETFIYFKF